MPVPVTFKNLIQNICPAVPDTEYRILYELTRNIQQNREKYLNEILCQIINASVPYNFNIIKTLEMNKELELLFIDKCHQ